ncbi:DUF4097 family beta strand repeat-containing protein [Actinomadura rupiterrae]|uniref:DUF4097 family beta strand repeat-containing protein n=1 Tax=Actinomadura rupiterrae TaxID=559627 RepID=UPI0020A53A82|nr:DUF4097 family beta strand repeat-containing protein [Actinomadura rupiterrae]MCP2334987.1 DUF4097 and DUF4098 domain-containing protein YvlB [Actinomadura rupiterrae]
MSLAAKIVPVSALLAVVPLSACGVGIDTAGTQDEQQTYTVPGRLTGLKVTGHTGDIEIIGADVSAVTVVERMRFTKNGRPKVSHSVANGTLQASYSCPNSISLTGHTCQVDYRVTVPRALAAEVRTDTGGVTLTGLTGNVTARANTGTITGSALRPAASGTVRARTDTGSVRLTFASAPASVDANANTGQIKILLPTSQRYAVTADSNTGRTRVSLPTSPNAPHTIKAHTDTGDLTVAPA